MNVPFTAYPALNIQMQVVDTIANNLANAQTNGFKRDFERIMKNDEFGLTLETHVDLSPGNLTATGNDLDVAIDGSGFFAVQTPAGIRYTRAGSFEVSSDGELVTKDGMKVLSSSGSPISVSGQTVSIQDGGAVFVDGVETGALKIVNFSDTAQLQKEGSHRFVWKGQDQNIQAVAEPRVKSGYLEGSNVNPVNEMVRLMSAYREFEAVQRALTTVNGEMTSKLIQESGRIG